MLKVPLSEEQLNDAVSEARRWFAAKKGVDREFTLNVVAGQPEYDMPADCDAVIDVSVQTSPFDVSLVFTPYIFADEKVPYDVFAAPQSAGLYSSFVQSLQYNEMAKRIIGADPNWIYFPNKKKLLLLPVRQYGGNAIIEYKSTLNTIEQLSERDADLVKRFALAWAKRDLGVIFSRYVNSPAAQGMTTLNGPALTAESVAEFAKLEQEVYDSAMPMPFHIG